MVDRVGQQLGNYRLLRLLGQGGFAEVYLGEHLYLKTQAAIKVLHAQIVDDNSESFIAEARTIASLVHPHIVRVLDFGIEQTIPFLVMDYAPHGTLRRRYPNGTLLPLTTIVPYVRQLADALQHAHNVKLIHRDIKPENMLLGSNDEVLLSDFGIATIARTSRATKPQDIAGTVFYMAPEQIQGMPRPASDQYALGIVVYEWITGGGPFHGSFTEVATQHIFAPPPPLREKVPALSKEVEQVVLKASEQRPSASLCQYPERAPMRWNKRPMEPEYQAHTTTHLFVQRTNLPPSLLHPLRTHRTHHPYKKREKLPGLL